MSMLSMPCVQRLLVPLFARTGIHSSFQHSGGMPDDAGAVVLVTVMGAFFGLVTGLVLLPVARYVAFLAGRTIAGGSWVVLASVLGAAAFCAWALYGDKE